MHTQGNALKELKKGVWTSVIELPLTYLSSACLVDAVSSHCYSTNFNDSANKECIRVIRIMQGFVLLSKQGCSTVPIFMKQ